MIFGISDRTTDMQTNRSAAVASNIRAEIARRNLSQRVIAEHLGVSQPSFSARMSGKTPIDVNELFAIADLLDVDPAALLKESA